MEPLTDFINLTETLLRHDGHDDDEHNHEHEDDDENALMIAKAVAMVSLFVLSMIFGMVPMKLNSCLSVNRGKGSSSDKTTGKTCSKKHHEDSLEGGGVPEPDNEPPESFQKPRIVKMLLNFGGGVLMATTFLHLLPEVKESIEALQEEKRIPHLDYQLAELLMCFGFFLMFLIDESVHVYIHRRERMNAVAPASGPGQPERAELGEDEKLEEIFHRNLSFRKRDLEKNFSSPAKKYPSVRSNSISQTNLISTKSDENLNENCRNVYVVPPGQVGNEAKSSTNPAAADAKKIKEQNAVAASVARKQPPKPTVQKEDTLVKNIRGLLIVLALSVHELFEGLAVGLENSPSNVYYMFGAISAHKLVIAFCIGIELVTSELKTKLIIAYITTFAVVSPLGIGLGLVLSSSAANGVPTAVLQGIACGTLLYVVFFEILLPGVQSKHEHSHLGEATHSHESQPEIRAAPAPAYDYQTAPPPHYTSNGNGAARLQQEQHVNGSYANTENGTSGELYKPIEDAAGGAAPAGNDEDAIRRRSETGSVAAAETNRAPARNVVKANSGHGHGHKHGHKGSGGGIMSDLGGLLQYFAVLVGFLVMFGLQFLNGGHHHSHGHSHGGGEDHGHSHGDEHGHTHGFGHYH